jgi:hypothetical protein
MEVVTKDTSAISDAELAEMADLCAEREPRFDLAYLTEVREQWVLISTAREGNKLRGYSFSTLERIGGTPCLLVGLALIDRNSKSEQALKALLADQFRRALLAFPDEEVLLGTRLMTDHGFRALQGLEDVVPRHQHKPTGEERAWARRLAKRFGNDKDLDDRTFIIAPKAGNPVGGLDVVAPKAKLPEGVATFFADVDADKGHRLVVFGWAMPEDLAAGRLTR